ncbi:hypothetical protein STEG23_006727, partial [Scotinomys teguina]
HPSTKMLKNGKGEEGPLGKTTTHCAIIRYTAIECSIALNVHINFMAKQRKRFCVGLRPHGLFSILFVMLLGINLVELMLVILYPSVDFDAVKDWIEKRGNDGRSLGSSVCVSLQIKGTDLAMARKVGQGEERRSPGRGDASPPATKKTRCRSYRHLIEKTPLYWRHKVRKVSMEARGAGHPEMLQVAVTFPVWILGSKTQSSVANR